MSLPSLVCTGPTVRKFVLVSACGASKPGGILDGLTGNRLVWKARGQEAVRRGGIDYVIVRAGRLLDSDGLKRGVEVGQVSVSLACAPDMLC
jgi:hypothetical protein